MSFTLFLPRYGPTKRLLYHQDERQELKFSLYFSPILDIMIFKYEYRYQMKKKIDKNIITGYIEGYYGKLLSWENRELIIKSLYKNKMNTYFYAPKEDINHRLCWKKDYNERWRSNFRQFTNMCKKFRINVIAVLPGLDYNFKQLIENTN